MPAFRAFPGGRSFPPSNGLPGGIGLPVPNGPTTMASVVDGGGGGGGTAPSALLFVDGPKMPRILPILNHVSDMCKSYSDLYDLLETLILSTINRSSID